MNDSNNSAGESQQGTIYKILCLVTGKPYVGKTKQKLEKRMAQHRYDSRKGSIGLGAAIRKYGWKNFTVEVIETCPVEKLNEREIFWIKEIGSKAPNGYNLTDGGEGLKGCTQGTRAKMSETQKIIGSRPPSFKGKHHSVEARAKLSKAGKGKPSHKKGKPLSAETRAKMSVSQKKRQARERLEREKKLLKTEAISDTLPQVSLMIFLWREKCCPRYITIKM